VIFWCEITQWVLF